MNLLVRLFLVFIRSFTMPRISKLNEITTLTFRVWPTDIDFHFIMNNARYLTFMELTRADFIFRSGFFSLAKKRKWIAIGVDQITNYSRSLKMFQKFSLTTQIIFFDDKWIYFEHKFKAKDNIVATGLVRATIRGKEGLIQFSKALRELNLEYYTTNEPEVVTKWNEVSLLIRENTKT